VTAPGRTDKDLRKPFIAAVCGVVIAFVLIGGVIAAFGTGEQRPEGVAERWLVAVGDTQRKGVRERSRDDAEEVGPVSLAAHLLPTEDTDGKSAFVDLEVGKAVEADGDIRHVPFRLHQLQGDEVSDAIDGTVVLEREGDDWKVVDVTDPTPGLEVPSEGGAPAADAPWGLYVGAIALAVVLTSGCTFLVRMAARPV
jgi:hypothetical protein